MILRIWCEVVQLVGDCLNAGSDNVTNLPNAMSWSNPGAVL